MVTHSRLPVAEPTRVANHLLVLFTCKQARLDVDYNAVKKGNVIHRVGRPAANLTKVKANRTLFK